MILKVEHCAQLYNVLFGSKLVSHLQHLKISIYSYNSNLFTFINFIIVYSSRQTLPARIRTGRRLYLVYTPYLPSLHVASEFFQKHRAHRTRTWSTFSSRATTINAHLQYAATYVSDWDNMNDLCLMSRQNVFLALLSCVILQI